MRNIILFLFLFASFALNAQSTLDKRFVLVAEWQDYVLLNDSMWRVNTNFADDQLNSGYLPTQIQVGYLALDATGRRYRIKQVGETTFSSAVLDVVEEADLNMPPIGVGIVYAPNLRDVIHSVVHSNTQISPSLMSKIFIHNMIKLDEISLLASDFTRLEQDSIIVYYSDSTEVDRDTIRLNIVSALAALSDVNVSGVADKGILYYDLATQQWRDTVSSVYLSGTGSVNRIPYYSAGSTLTNSANLTFDGTALNVNSSAVFNDAGAAVNFRVESDNDENKIFVSGSTDRVGIGTNSPTNTLDIDGTLRIRTLNAVTSTGILGIDANGVAERITLGSGLSLVNDVLTATGTLSGSGTTGEIAYWSGGSELTSSPRMKFETDGGLVLKNTAQPVRTTVVAAQGFAADTTNWTAGAGWSFNGSVAVATAATGDLTYAPTVTITSGNAYLVTVSQSGYTAGDVTMVIGNATQLMPKFDLTNYAFLLRPTTAGSLRFTTSGYTGNLDNVSVVEITSSSILMAYELSSSTTNLLPTVVPNTTSQGYGGGLFYATGANNTAQGSNAGRNITTGAATIAQGPNAGAANTTGSSWIAQGSSAGASNVTGGSWIAQGAHAGISNVTGGSWIAQGTNAGGGNLSGSNWIAQGTNAGAANTTGNNWIAKGSQAGVANISGSDWIAIGERAGGANTTGSDWVAIGETAARSYSNFSASANFENSVYIGAQVRVGGTSGLRTNETVIGYQAVGNGDNTVTLGNSSILRHVLSGTGQVRIPTGTTAQQQTGTVGDLRYNTTNSNIEFHSGTAWQSPLLAFSGNAGEIPYLATASSLTSSTRMKFETDGGLVLKNTSEASSSTFLANQTFDSNTDWTEGAGWLITGGQAVATAATGNLTYIPTLTITNGRTYQIQITQSNYSSGTLTVRLGNASATVPSTNLTHIFTLSPSVSTDGFRFTTSNYTGNIDNISIIEFIGQTTIISSYEISSSPNNIIPTRVTSSSLYIGGGGSRNTGINNISHGFNSGTNNTTGSNWIAQGVSAGASNITGSNWIAQGFLAGASNVTGNSWFAQGRSAGSSNISGSFWFAQGQEAGLFNTSGSNWAAQGYQAGLSNTTGSNWLAYGFQAGRNNTTGNSWIAIGGNSALTFSDGTLANFENSIYIGSNTRAGGTLDPNNIRTNEIVIGHAVTGNGSNTVTLGNSSILRHVLSGTGQVRIPTGTTAQRQTIGLIQGDIRANTDTDLLDHYNGTAWRRVYDYDDTNPATGDIASFSGASPTVVSSRRGIITGTPDGSGDFTLTFATAMPDNTYTATAISEGTTAYIISVHTKATGSVKFRIFNDAGVPVTSGTITINYSVTDY